MSLYIVSCIAIVAIFALGIRDKEARAAKKELAEWWDALPVPLCTVDAAAKRFIRVNPALCQALGYSAEALTATSYMDFIHPEDRAKTLLIIEEYARGHHEAGDGFVNRYTHGKTSEDIYLRWLTGPKKASVSLNVTQEILAAERVTAQTVQLDIQSAALTARELELDDSEQAKAAQVVLLAQKNEELEKVNADYRRLVDGAFNALLERNGAVQNGA